MYKIITEMDDYKPRIWRRILISENTSVTDFAYGIMGIYNAEGYHLWNVESMGQKPPRQRLTWANAKTYMYVNEDSLDWEDYQNPDTHKVSDLFNQKGDIVLVNYDFGDSWCFKCVLEEISEDDGTQLPSVLKWKGHGIIDDCGGVWGLEEALEEYDEEIEPWTTESLTDALRLKDSPFPEIYKVMKEESDKIFANPEEYRSPERKKAVPESFLNMIEMINQAVENGDINSLLKPPTKGTVITAPTTEKK
jgi:hypothetical protein